MGLFSGIKNAIWGKAKAKAAAKPAATRPAATAPVAPKPVAAAPAAAVVAPAPVEMDEVDVAELLEEMAETSAVKLNWRTSIVDLLKLLDLDFSLTARKELAEELGYTGERDGSAEMNIWLHKAVMKELAKNGGKVPADMLD